jgi:hypothetical protein
MNSVSKKLAIALLILAAAALLDASPRSKALFRSLLIPGWGELANGGNSGWAFMASETALWSSRFYFVEEADLNRRDSYQYALHYAHLAPGGYNDATFFAMSKYNSSGYESGGYNEHIMREAIAQGLSGDDLQNYLAANAMPDDLYWNWDDLTNRARYVKMRREITHCEDYAKTMTGLIVLNHLLSGLNAARIAGKNTEFHVGWNRGPMVLGTYRF